MTLSLGILYGIHPGEMLAVQVGRLIAEDGTITTFQADHSPRHRNYRDAFGSGTDLLVDLHSSRYGNEPTIPQSIVLREHFVTPILPIKKGTIQAILEKPCVRDIGDRFKVFYTSELDRKSGVEIITMITSDGGQFQVDENPHRTRMTKYHHYLARKGLFRRIVTIEYWSNGERLLEGIGDEVLEHLKGETYRFCDWVRGSAEELFL